MCGPYGPNFRSPRSSFLRHQELPSPRPRPARPTASAPETDGHPQPMASASPGPPRSLRGSGHRQRDEREQRYRGEEGQHGLSALRRAPRLIFALLRVSVGAARPRRRWGVGSSQEGSARSSPVQSSAMVGGCERPISPTRSYVSWHRGAVTRAALMPLWPQVSRASDSYGNGNSSPHPAGLPSHCTRCARMPIVLSC